MQGCGVSSGLSVRASRPQRIATSGWSRSARARIACSVTASQPLPRWEPGLPGATVRTRLRSRTPCVVQGVRSPFCGLREAEVLAVLLEDVAEAAGERPDVRGDAEARGRPGGRASGTDPGRRSARGRRRAAAGGPRGCGSRWRQERAVGGALGPQEVAELGDHVGSPGASASAQPGPTLSASERVEASAVLTPAIVGGSAAGPAGAQAARLRRRTTIRGGALVAQGIEQRFPKPCVGGSSPPGGIAMNPLFLEDIPANTRLMCQRVPDSSVTKRSGSVMRSHNVAAHVAAHAREWPPAGQPSPALNPPGPRTPPPVSDAVRDAASPPTPFAHREWIVSLLASASATSRAQENRPSKRST